MTLAAFGPWDWGVLGLYFLLVSVVSLWAHWAERRSAATGTGTTGYFLGNRSLPTWTVAVSIVASSLSAATFVGVPDAAYKGDLSYLSQYLGAMIAVFVVAFLFVPRLYAAGTVTIYGFLARRFGEPARLAVSLAFIVGRLLSSGSRLFIAAIPLSLLIFGSDPSKPQLVACIFLVGGIATVYTVLGGVRTVVWLDVLQLTIVIGTALLTIGLLLHRIPLSPADVYHTLAATTAPAKLRVINTSLDPALDFTIWTALFGMVFQWTAALGVDHDLAQRFLITKSARKGALSVILSQFVSVAVVSLFLAIGLLLYVFYDRPDVMGAAHAKPGAGTAMYTWFLLNELPPVLTGICIAGFFAIAQGSMDSAVNALAASLVADVIQPWRAMRGEPNPAGEERLSKAVTAGVGVTMCLFAVFCALTYDPASRTLLAFVLGIMTFAFTGMLGVFLTALLTRRGSNASVIAALITGAAVVLLLQDPILGPLSAHFGKQWKLAFPWWMMLGTLAAFLVCLTGNSSPRNSQLPTRNS